MTLHLGVVRAKHTNIRAGGLDRLGSSPTRPIVAAGKSESEAITLRSGKTDSFANDLVVEPTAEVVTLAELRHRAKLSQRELGERLNRQQTAIARIEKRENPTVNALRQFIQSVGGELELTVKVPGKPAVKLALPR